MKIKSVAFIYENMNTNLPDIEKDTSDLLKDLINEGKEIIDVKTCLNNEGDALITIVYEYETED